MVELTLPIQAFYIFMGPNFINVFLVNSLLSHRNKDIFLDFSLKQSPLTFRQLVHLEYIFAYVSWEDLKLSISTCLANCLHTRC